MELALSLLNCFSNNAAAQSLVLTAVATKASMLMRLNGWKT